LSLHAMKACTIVLAASAVRDQATGCSWRSWSSQTNRWPKWRTY